MTASSLRGKLAAPAMAMVAAAFLMANAPAPKMPGDPVPDTFTIGGKSGHPLDNLPAGTRLISPFGERAAFSPDGRRIAFVGKMLGDAFEYDIATGKTRNLTANVAHNGIVRVHYLPDGSYIVVAPQVLEASAAKTRVGRLELFWMDAQASRLVPFREPIYEGVAVSRKSNKIAWVVNEPIGTKPVEAQEAGHDGTSTLKSGRVVVSGGSAKLVDVHVLTTTKWSDCQLEAQDFLPDDRSVVGPCYNVRKTQIAAAVRVEDGKVFRYPTPQNLFGELEGIFPDGRRQLVECANYPREGLDLCLLELGGEHRYRRLTHVQDFGHYSFSNPVVAPDGRRIAFQFAIPSDPPGAGRGILLMDLPKGF